MQSVYLDQLLLLFAFFFLHLTLMFIFSYDIPVNCSLKMLKVAFNLPNISVTSDMYQVTLPSTSSHTKPLPNRLICNHNFCAREFLCIKDLVSINGNNKAQAASFYKHIRVPSESLLVKNFMWSNMVGGNDFTELIFRGKPRTPSYHCMVNSSLCIITPASPTAFNRHFIIHYIAKLMPFWNAH